MILDHFTFNCVIFCHYRGEAGLSWIIVNNFVAKLNAHSVFIYMHIALWNGRISCFPFTYYEGMGPSWIFIRGKLF